MNKYSEWSETIKAFWFGANNYEYIARKGSHKIDIYNCRTYPNPPEQIIQGDRRIETTEDFDYVLENGQAYKVNYEIINTQ